TRFSRDWSSDVCSSDLMYNMYALQRNAFKYQDRDKRYEKIHLIEYDYLAPDTVNEMFDSIALFEKLVGQAYGRKTGEQGLTAEDAAAVGKRLLATKDPVVKELEVLATGFENAKRPVKIIKVQKAYDLFRK